MDLNQATGEVQFPKHSHMAPCTITKTLNQTQQQTAHSDHSTGKSMTKCHNFYNLILSNTPSSLQLNFKIMHAPVPMILSKVTGNTISSIKREKAANIPSGAPCATTTPLNQNRYYLLNMSKSQ